MNACVYILKFEKSGKYYVGSTSDIIRRLNQHKTGQTVSTKRKNENFEVVFSQNFESLNKAREIERRIKGWKRRDFIEKIINDGEIKISLDAAG
ncbi:GIY-YIG nuclease family protein [Candidatus Saccharibacteria bacterium]|nr:GIY-YIG nuclease family protein [Candidatus Saccharibacteria bacterium]